MKYEVGDKVRIVSERADHNWGVGMDRWLDEIMTIKSVGSEYYAMVEDDGYWSWEDCMIAGLADESVSEPQNIMPEVAQRLGVKIGEEFEVEESPNNPWTFTENGLIAGSGYAAGNEWRYILTGEWKIVKKSWKPKDGDKYFYIESDGNISWDKFDSENPFDCAMLESGNFFRTYQEAEANREAIMEKFGWK